MGAVEICRPAAVGSQLRVRRLHGKQLDVFFPS